jgi:hypothetical protein
MVQVVLDGRADHLTTDEPLNELAADYGPGSPAAVRGRQQVFLAPEPHLAYLALNTSQPPFSDPTIRWAVNLALDPRRWAGGRPTTPSARRRRLPQRGQVSGRQTRPRPRSCP